jgi:hypothetical protein
VHREERFEPKEEQWFGYLEKVKAAVRKIREEGTTRVSLVTNGP